MNRNSLRILLVSTVLVGSSLMCSLFGPANGGKVSEQEKQATINSLQQTVSVLQQLAVTATVEPTVQISLATMVKLPTGSISGSLSYPSEGIPPLRIVAIKIGTGEYFATEVTDHNTYGLEGLPEGKYHVLVYRVDPAGADPNLVGGYSQFVLCGQTADCTDHSLIDVEVKDGTVTTNINPVDWYAPAGAFPPDPTK
jgi:hypothetical protein